MSDWTAAAPDHHRFYCPRCGEVQWAGGRFRTVHGDRVAPHDRWGIETRPQLRINPFAATEPLRELLCAGGDIDPDKDRAP